MKTRLPFLLATALLLSAAWQTSVAQTQIGADILGPNDFSQFGTALDVSNDGGRIVVGASTEGAGGQVRVFEFVNGAWTPVGNAIDGASGAEAGKSVAISADGSRIIVGSPFFNTATQTLVGRARVFDLIGSVWTQVGNDLTGTNASDAFGGGVDISDDGTTIVVGALGADGVRVEAGQVTGYQLRTSTSTWVAVGPAVEGVIGNDRIGEVLALSGDGSRLAIGSVFSRQSRVFALARGGWQQRGSVVAGGTSVSLSHGGDTLVTGNDRLNTDSGAAFTYVEVNAVYTASMSTLFGDDRNDFFGRTVALSGDGQRLAVTSIADDDGGSNAGRVRLYERVFDTWQPLGNPLDGAAAQERFGTAAAMTPDGGAVVIGAPTPVQNSRGKVEVYRLPASPYTSFPKPVGFPVTGIPGERTASAAAFTPDGSRVVLGSSQDLLVNGGGVVEVLDYVAGVWTRVGQQLIGGAVGDDFGFSVDISDDGTRIAVGAPGTNDANGLDDTGLARVYTLINNVWTPLGAGILAEVGGDRCGASVAFSANGNRLAVGAPQHDNPNSPIQPTNNGYGQIRVFDLVNGAWAAASVSLEGQALFDLLGGSCDFNPAGDRLVVGADGASNPSNNQSAGVVRVYDLAAAGTWTQVGADLFGVSTFDLFGFRVSISDDGTRIATSALFGDADPALDRLTNEGRVYTYDLTGGAWVETGNLLGPTTGQFFGHGLDLSADGNRLIAGGPRANMPNATGLGVAQVYDYNGSWTPVFTQLQGGSAGDEFGFAVAISDDGTRVCVTAPGLDATTSTSNNGRAYFYQLSPFNAPPLPVELTAFSAVAKTRHVALAWTTASEIGASHFEVERSDDGATWTTVGTVAAAGDTDATTTYGFSDDAPLAGANYYRLRQVDVDGAEAFSGVEVVYFAAASASLGDVRVYPNPAREFLAVVGLPDAYGPEGPGGEVTARLLDVSGREVAALGFGDSRILLSGVPAGVYALVVDNATEHIVRRVVVE